MDYRETIMKTQVLKESGYEEALLGMSLSYYREGDDIDAWWATQFLKAEKRALKLAFKGASHAKFLRAITVQILCTAPRAFWQEADQYKVGFTTLSASTMHTLAKGCVSLDNFEEGTKLEAVETFNRLLSTSPDISTLKFNLPEGYLQTRLITTNYAAIQNIVAQRHDHRLKQWPEFCEALRSQLEHPEFLYPEP